GPPHVPELYGEGTLADGTPYLVFERLRMPTLASRLGAPLAPRDALALAVPVLAALAAAHDHGFIHSDLKPENIFVATEPPRGTLIDFGLARTTAGDDDITVRTMAESSDGVVMGTALYMAPEQCEGRAILDVRADIYAMGAVLYE